MKSVFIKYNPYKVETELTVDGNQLAENSIIGERIQPGTRLQEWVEDLPEMLIDEYNDTDFDIGFHGTLPDYEDLSEAFKQAYEREDLKAKLGEIHLDRKPAKEIADKEKLIDKVFKKIQDGPFDELRGEEIINAFEHAKSSDFEVCVVATMSAGKSTLINSMLGTKLMPSRREACTAIITKIKDTDSSSGTWQAEVYDREGQLFETHKKLTYETMVRLNDSKQVSVINVDGDIPFVSSEGVSLVLIDTPGPDSALNPEHKNVWMKYMNKSSKTLVLYVMEGTYGSDDEYALLERVSESMKVGGKQSKDRFLFVVNKMDEHKREEDVPVADMLTKIRMYLQGFGITNPNLFPASALTALNIRRIESGANVDVDTVEDTEKNVKKLNRNDALHLEQYAPLPASVRGSINDELAKAKEDPNAEALIHTGVASIEAAIRQYVEKYAKTAKIKNIVDTFMHKLEEVGYVEKTKQELVQNQERCDDILRQINLIHAKIDDGEEAKKFQSNVHDQVDKVQEDARAVIDGINVRYQKKIMQRIDNVRGRELSMGQVEKELSELREFISGLEENYQSELEEIVSESLIETGKALLREYRKKLASLANDIVSDTSEGMTIEPLKLMSGSIAMEDVFSVTELLRSKEVENGKVWVENTNKKWWKFWTWFQEDGYYRTKYKTVKYVLADELAQSFLAPAEDALLENEEAALEYVAKQSEGIETAFNKEFEHLDNVLKQKMEELESYATDKEKAEARVEDTQRKLEWLQEIEQEVSSILEI